MKTFLNWEMLNCDGIGRFDLTTDVSISQKYQYLYSGRKASRKSQIIQT